MPRHEARWCPAVVAVHRQLRLEEDVWSWCARHGGRGRGGCTSTPQRGCWPCSMSPTSASGQGHDATRRGDGVPEHGTSSGATVSLSVAIANPSSRRSLKACEHHGGQDRILGARTAAVDERPCAGRAPPAEPAPPWSWGQGSCSPTVAAVIERPTSVSQGRNLHHLPKLLRRRAPSSLAPGRFGKAALASVHGTSCPL